MYCVSCRPADTWCCVRLCVVLERVVYVCGMIGCAFTHMVLTVWFYQYRSADKSLARPTSRCILFDGENISFDASLVIYIYI